MIIVLIELPNNRLVTLRLYYGLFLSWIGQRRDISDNYTVQTFLGSIHFFLLNQNQGILTLENNSNSPEDPVIKNKLRSINDKLVLIKLNRIKSTTESKRLNSSGESLS